MPANHPRKMTKIGRSLQLVVWLGVWMLESLPVARSAEPTKNPPSVAVLPIETSKVLAQPASLARSNKLLHYVQVWAAKDPQEALVWTKKNTADFEQQQLINVILWEWAQHDPTAAAVFALQKISANR
jgi:hypothetical protein